MDVWEIHKLTKCDFCRKRGNPWFTSIEIAILDLIYVIWRSFCMHVLWSHIECLYDFFFVIFRYAHHIPRAVDVDSHLINWYQTVGFDHIACHCSNFNFNIYVWSCYAMSLSLCVYGDWMIHWWWMINLIKMLCFDEFCGSRFLQFVFLEFLMNMAMFFFEFQFFLVFWKFKFFK